MVTTLEKKLQLSNLDISYGTLISSRLFGPQPPHHYREVCLYANAIAKTKFQFCEVISVVHDKLTLEKYIATKLGERDNFFENRPSYKVTSRLLLLLLLLFIRIFYTMKAIQMT